MARPLCNDLRERVVAALSGDRLGCAWQNGRTPRAAVEAASHLRRKADQPDAASDANRSKDELGARRAIVSRNTIWLFLRREGLWIKKMLLALEQGRADVARQRRRCRSWQPCFEAPGTMLKWPAMAEFKSIDRILADAPFNVTVEVSCELPPPVCNSLRQSDNAKSTYIESDY
jgi:hypothetical protein